MCYRSFVEAHLLNQLRVASGLNSAYPHNAGLHCGRAYCYCSVYRIVQYFGHLIVVLNYSSPASLGPSIRACFHPFFDPTSLPKSHHLSTISLHPYQYLHPISIATRRPAAYIYLSTILSHHHHHSAWYSKIPSVAYARMRSLTRNHPSRLCPMSSCLIFSSMLTAQATFSGSERHAKLFYQPATP